MLLEIRTVPILDCGALSHEKFLSIDRNPLRSRKCLWCLHEWESYPKRPPSCPQCRELEWDRPMLNARLLGTSRSFQAENGPVWIAEGNDDGTDAR